MPNPEQKQGSPKIPKQQQQQATKRQIGNATTTKLQHTEEILIESSQPTESTNTETMTRKELNNQQSLRRRIRRRDQMPILAFLLVGCIAIGCCAAFHISHPYSNRAFRRLQVTMGAEDTETGSSSSAAAPVNGYDRQEFEMQVGRAMDTLRDDYPDILVKDLDYSIYDSDLELIDPSGVHLHGLRNYENAIRLVHTLVSIFYCPEQSGMKFRMCFDKARQNIRIHWNANVVPKAIFGGDKTTLHLDGISIYELDRQSGHITQHRLERLVVNDNHINAEEGVFAALRNHAIQAQVDGIPSFHRHMDAMSNIGGDALHNNQIDRETTISLQKFPDHILRFQKNFGRGSLLFGEDNNGEDSSQLMKSFVTASSSRSRLNTLSSSASSEADGSMENSPMSDALAKKNAARKKFGLKPLNMEEFMELEKQVKEMETQQQSKAAAAAVEAMELERAKEQQKSRGGFLGKLFRDTLQDTCESNYDCERPEVCCDFGFKKMCCSSGMRVVDGFRNKQGQLAHVPVPIENPNPYPGNDPRNRDSW